MKCDELKYEKLGDMMPFYPRSTLVIRKQFVDAAIAELKAMVTTDNSAVIVRLEDKLRKIQHAICLLRADYARKEWVELYYELKRDPRNINHLKKRMEKYEDQKQYWLRRARIAKEIK